MEINRNVLLPNLVTVGNGVCGFAALTWLFKVQVVEGEGGLVVFNDAGYFAAAAWLVLLGMVFDVFDGKVARLSGGASALGAQLDSLCDLVTFGLVPAVMMLRLSMTSPEWWQRVVWFFSLAYFLGVTLRLARFTAENEPEESAHVAFKGLPSPGAAGCVASLVLFFSYISEFKARELQWISGFIEPETLQHYVGCIPLILPPLGLILGFTMVSSRLRFEHVGSRVFNRRHSFDFFVYLIFGAILVFLLPEIILPIIFLGYLIYSPARFLLRSVFSRKAPQVPDEYVH